MNLVEFAKQFEGRQETAGPNRGPLVDKWKSEVSAGLTHLPIPWCACFGFAMIHELTGLDKKGIAEALGFDAATWYPESTRSWLAQARQAKRAAAQPKFGDLFLLMKPDGKGGYLANEPHHLGIFAASALPAPGQPFSTVEGNTVPGGVSGPASREGDGVYARFRHNVAGAFTWISLPSPLTRK